LADRPSSPAPVTLKPVPMETSEVVELMMESTTNSRKDTSTTEETTRRQVLKELVEMTTKRKEVSTTSRRKSMGAVRRGSRPLSQRASVVRRRLDSVVTQSRPAASTLTSSTPRPRMVRPSYSGAGGRDRVGQWDRKVSSAPKKPLRRMKIRGGGPSNRDFSGAQAEDKKPLLLPAVPLVSKHPNQPIHLLQSSKGSRDHLLPSPQGVFSQATDLLLSWTGSQHRHLPTVTV